MHECRSCELSSAALCERNGWLLLTSSRRLDRSTFGSIDDRLRLTRRVSTSIEQLRRPFFLIWPAVAVGCAKDKDRR